MKRIDVDDALSAKQRLALFHNTSISAEKAIGMPESEMTFDVFISSGVRALNISSAGIGPHALKTRFDVKTASQLRRLGFDSLHLVDPAFATEANAAFGAEAITNAFLDAPQDAVAVAGSQALETLNVSLTTLLEYCAGAPHEAFAVLEQTTDHETLTTVPIRVLLDTGLRAPKLRELGITIPLASRMVGADAASLAKLGFKI
ncbi:MAG: hypothetical protein VW555_04495 [Luminiphilus sp.]